MQIVTRFCEKCGFHTDHSRVVWWNRGEYWSYICLRCSNTEYTEEEVKKGQHK